MQRFILILSSTALLLACQPSGQGEAPKPQVATTAPQPAAVQQARIVISSPDEITAILDNKTLFLDYEIVGYMAGMRVTLVLDGKTITTLDQAKGSYPLGKHKPGAHLIKMELLDANNASLGVTASRIFKIEATPEE
jgi:hypothetical protein